LRHSGHLRQSIFRGHLQIRPTAETLSSSTPAASTNPRFARLGVGADVRRSAIGASRLGLRAQLPPPPPTLASLGSVSAPMFGAPPSALRASAFGHNSRRLHQPSLRSARCRRRCSALRHRRFAPRPSGTTPAASTTTTQCVCSLTTHTMYSWGQFGGTSSMIPPPLGSFHACLIDLLISTRLLRRLHDG
jgi:hypothetical protein